MSDYGDAMRRLTEYGEQLGLTTEQAREVIRMWCLETPLSLIYDEDVLRVPLRFRAHDDFWRPSQFIGPVELIRQVLPLVDMMDGR